MSVRHQCHWFESPIGLVKTADVVIIGGGFAGVSLLYTLSSLDPTLNVVLLEESSLGYHASGRTLGYVKSLDDNMFRTLKNKYSEEVAMDYYRFIETSNRKLFSMVQSESIDCGLEINGGIHLASTMAESEKIQRFQSLLTEEFFTQPMSSSDLSSLVSTGRYKFGMYVPNEATLDPYKLIQELAEVTEQTGRRCITNAKVDSIYDEGDDIIIHVRNRGKITTKNIVYCTGAYTSEFVPLVDQATVRQQHFFTTKQLPNNVSSAMSKLPITHRDRVIRLNGNVLMACGQTLDIGSLDDGELSQEQYDKLRHAVNAVYPDLTKRFGVDKIWTAVEVVSNDGVPFVGPVPEMPGHFMNIGHGFNGYGSAFGAAEIIAEYILTDQSINPTANLMELEREG